MIKFEIQRLVKDKTGQSMAAFSEQMDLDPQTLYYWNQGQSLPRIPTLLLICQLLSISWAELGEYLTIKAPQKG